MAKVFTYMMIIVGLMVLFYVAGLNSGGNSVTGTYLQNPDSASSQFSASAFFSQWGLLLGALAAIGIGITILGFFGRNIITVPTAALFATTILVVFVWDLISITQTPGLADWAKWAIWLITSPMIMGFILSIFEWTMGGGQD